MMTTTPPSNGTIHEVPDDLRQILSDSAALLERWSHLTPLARNERICRVTIVKQEKTRAEHLQRLVDEVGKGKKRPCCRPGCPHHRDSAQKWFVGMKK